MIQTLKKEYWSKADAFLLPLVGLDRDEKYELHSYLFWNEYSIEDYKLIITLASDDYEGMVEYCRMHIFPILDRNGYVMENYDVGFRSVFVLDISEWAMDVQMFLAGKYSKFSKQAKEAIERYHKFNGNKIPIHIYSVLYPGMQMALLDKKSPIEYTAEQYGINLEDLQRIGEMGSIYDVALETLWTDVRELCGEDDEEEILKL